MLKMAVLGTGRMARSVLEVIDEHDRCLASSVWIHDPGKVSEFQASFGDRDVLISDKLESVLAAADIAIDFTLADANASVIERVVAAGTPLVCGVSGLDDAQTRALSEASGTIPLLYDRNMSYGIAVLTRLLRDAGTALGSGFATEIHETHHRHKKDAPSGTALLLGETLAESRGRKLDDIGHYDPAGKASTAKDAINFFVTREGEVAGDHEVVFHNSLETLKFSHSVADRRVFADGAIRAALWLAGKDAGLYRMDNVLSD